MYKDHTTTLAHQFTLLDSKALIDRRLLFVDRCRLKVPEQLIFFMSTNEIRKGLDQAS